MFQLPRSMSSDEVKERAQDYMMLREYDDAYTLLKSREMIPPTGALPPKTSASPRPAWRDADKSRISYQVSECCWLASQCISCSTTFFQGEELIKESIKLATYARDFLPAYEDRLFYFYRPMIEEHITLPKKALENYRKNLSLFPHLPVEGQAIPATTSAAMIPSDSRDTK